MYYKQSGVRPNESVLTGTLAQETENKKRGLRVGSKSQTSFAEGFLHDEGCARVGLVAASLVVGCWLLGLGYV